MKKIYLLVLLALSVMTQVQAQSQAQSPEVKNVIYMIGDGMGFSHISAMMIANGYNKTAFDRVHSAGMVKTFSANNRVTDSAAAGTALASGHKTNNGTLGIDAKGDTVFSIMTKAAKRGVKTGILVTCEVQHATPAAFYSHVNSRGSMEDIAKQLSASNIDVIIGGGLKYMSSRKDKIDLVKQMKKQSYNFCGDTKELNKINSGKVLALIDSVRPPYVDEGRGNYLPEATAKALEILNNNAAASGDKGFFLMIEGSQIDFAGHKGDIGKVVAEVEDFEKSVAVAMDFADKHPGTLVVITADHETGGLTMPSGNSDFTKGEGGINFKFSSTSHTGIMVPVMAYGPGSEKFSGVFDNTDLPKIIAKLTGIN